MAELDMAQRIKDLRVSQNLTLEQVANEVGVGKSTVRKWETGMIANMRRDKIASLAKALHTTPAYLMGWIDEPHREITVDNLFRIETKKFPLLGNIACGEPIMANEEVDLYVEAGANRKCIDLLMGQVSKDTGNRVYNHKTLDELKATVALIQC